MYRLWSACRARQAWLIQAGVLQSGYGVGAETLAVDFAIQIQQAAWLGQEFDGLALDRSSGTTTLRLICFVTP